MTEDKKLNEILERQTKAFENLGDFLVTLRKTKTNRLSTVVLPTGYSMKDIVEALEQIAVNTSELNKKVEEVSKEVIKAIKA